MSSRPRASARAPKPRGPQGLRGGAGVGGSAFLERGSQLRHVRGQRAGKPQALARDRMHERKLGGVQSLAAERRQRGLRLLAELARARLEAGPVSRIAQQRMADMGKMHAYLMGAPGLEGQP